MEQLRDNCYASCGILQLGYSVSLRCSRVATLANQEIFNAFWYNLVKFLKIYFEKSIAVRQLIVSAK